MRRKLKLQSDPYTPRVPSNRRIVHNGLMSYWDFRGGYMTTTVIDRVSRFISMDLPNR